jgi:magnesium transporter
MNVLETIGLSGSRKTKGSKAILETDAPFVSSPSPPHNQNGSCALEAPGAICVSIPHGGKPIKTQGLTPEEFITTLHGSTLAWINFTVSDIEKEAVDIAMKLGFSSSLVPNLLKGYYADFQDNETEIGIMIPAVQINDLELKTFPLLVLVRSDLIVTIHSREVKRLVTFARYADHYLKRFSVELELKDKMTLMLVRILDENNNVNFEQLREIEEQADNMSVMLLNAKTDRMLIARKIYEMKHTLITYMNTLWRTLDVLHTLRYGEPELISADSKILAQVGLLADDVNRQIGLSEHMSNVLASGLEVLQTIYNNQLQILNNRMSYTITWLTILGTAVLVPNTLATIVGSITGMELPIMVWYLTVMTFATLGATYLAWWWVRRWVLLPKNAE